MCAAKSTEPRGTETLNIGRDSLFYSHNIPSSRGWTRLSVTFVLPVSGDASAQFDSAEKHRVKIRQIDETQCVKYITPTKIAQI